MELTQELIKSIFDYRDGILYWKVRSDNNKRNPGDIAGHLFTVRLETRRSIKLNKRQYLASRLIFLYHYGFMPEMVDHENRNTLDDRIENLRAADKYKNARNVSSRRGSTSKYLGVYFRPKAISNPWMSDIQANGKKKYLGVFRTQEQAALAYNRAAVMHHKDFANLNIITPPDPVAAVAPVVAAGEVA